MLEVLKTVFDLLFKREDGNGLNIKNQNGSIVAGKIINKHETTYNTFNLNDSLKTVNLPPSVTPNPELSEIDSKHKGFWESLIFIFLLGSASLLAIMFSASNITDLYKNDLFSKVFSNGHWIALGSMFLALAFGNRYLKLVEKAYCTFETSKIRKKVYIVVGIENIPRLKGQIKLCFLAFSTIPIYYLSKILFMLFIVI